MYKLLGLRFSKSNACIANINRKYKTGSPSRSRPALTQSTKESDERENCEKVARKLFPKPRPKFFPISIPPLPHPLYSISRCYVTNQKILTNMAFELYKTATEQINNIQRRRSTSQWKTTLFGRCVSKKGGITYPTYNAKHSMAVARRYKIKEGSSRNPVTKNRISKECDANIRPFKSLSNNTPSEKETKEPIKEHPTVHSASQETKMKLKPKFIGLLLKNARKTQPQAKSNKKKAKQEALQIQAHPIPLVNFDNLRNEAKQFSNFVEKMKSNARKEDKNTEQQTLEKLRQIQSEKLALVNQIKNISREASRTQKASKAKKNKKQSENRDPEDDIEDINIVTLKEKPSKVVVNSKKATTEKNNEETLDEITECEELNRLATQKKENAEKMKLRQQQMLKRRALKEKVYSSPALKSSVKDIAKKPINMFKEKQVKDDAVKKKIEQIYASEYINTAHSYMKDKRMMLAAKRVFSSNQKDAGEVNEGTNPKEDFYVRKQKEWEQILKTGDVKAKPSNKAINVEQTENKELSGASANTSPEDKQFKENQVINHPDQMLTVKTIEQRNETFEDAGLQLKQAVLEAGDEIVLLEKRISSEKNEVLQEIEESAVEFAEDVLKKVEGSELKESIVKEDQDKILVEQRHDIAPQLAEKIIELKEDFSRKNIVAVEKIDKIDGMLNRIKKLLEDKAAYFENKPRLPPIPKQLPIDQKKDKVKKDKPKGPRDMVLPPKVQTSIGKTPADSNLSKKETQRDNIINLQRLEIKIELESETNDQQKKGNSKFKNVARIFQGMVNTAQINKKSPSLEVAKDVKPTSTYDASQSECKRNNSADGELKKLKECLDKRTESENLPTKKGNAFAQDGNQSKENAAVKDDYCKSSGSISSEVSQMKKEALEHCKENENSEAEKEQNVSLQSNNKYQSKVEDYIGRQQQQDTALSQSKKEGDSCSEDVKKMEYSQGNHSLKERVVDDSQNMNKLRECMDKRAEGTKDPTELVSPPCHDSKTVPKDKKSDLTSEPKMTVHDACKKSKRSEQVNGRDIKDPCRNGNREGGTSELKPKETRNDGQDRNATGKIDDPCKKGDGIKDVRPDTHSTATRDKDPCKENANQSKKNASVKNEYCQSSGSTKNDVSQMKKQTLDKEELCKEKEEPSKASHFVKKDACDSSSRLQSNNKDESKKMNETSRRPQSKKINLRESIKQALVNETKKSQSKSEVDPCKEGVKEIEHSQTERSMKTGNLRNKGHDKDCHDGNDKIAVKKRDDSPDMKKLKECLTKRKASRKEGDELFMNNSTRESELKSPKLKLTLEFSQVGSNETSPNNYNSGVDRSSKGDCKPITSNGRTTNNQNNAKRPATTRVRPHTANLVNRQAANTKIVATVKEIISKPTANVAQSKSAISLMNPKIGEHENDKSKIKSLRHPFMKAKIISIYSKNESSTDHNARNSQKYDQTEVIEKNKNLGRRNPIVNLSPVADTIAEYIGHQGTRTMDKQLSRNSKQSLVYQGAVTPAPSSVGRLNFEAVKPNSIENFSKINTDLPDVASVSAKSTQKLVTHGLDVKKELLGFDIDYFRGQSLKGEIERQIKIKNANKRKRMRAKKDLQGEITF